MAKVGAEPLSQGRKGQEKVWQQPKLRYRRLPLSLLWWRTCPSRSIPGKPQYVIQFITTKYCHWTNTYQSWYSWGKSILKCTFHIFGVTINNQTIRHPPARIIYSWLNSHQKKTTHVQSQDFQWIGKWIPIELHYLVKYFPWHQVRIRYKKIF